MKCMNCEQEGIYAHHSGKTMFMLCEKHEQAPEQRIAYPTQATATQIPPMIIGVMNTGEPILDEINTAALTTATCRFCGHRIVRENANPYDNTECSDCRSSRIRKGIKESITGLKHDQTWIDESLKFPETDPNGIDAHAPGAKLDAGKLKAALVMGDFARALTEVIRVGTFGANKYSPHGWLSVDDAVERYTDAMQRHYLKEITEGPLDDDSGITHAGHLAWNALARLELMLRDAAKEKK